MDFLLFCKRHIAYPFSISLLVSFPLSSIAARDEVIYKCKQNNGTLLYSSLPCIRNEASKIKVLRIDESQINIYESKFDPAENPANRPMTLAERRKFFIPEANEVDSLDYLRTHPVAEIRMPALEAMESSFSKAKAYFNRLVIRLKHFFINSFEMLANFRAI